MYMEIWLQPIGQEGQTQHDWLVEQDNNIKLEFSEMIVFRSIKRKIDLCSFQSKKQSRLDSFIDK